MSLLKRIKGWFGGKRAAPALPAGPRHYHPLDVSSLTCRRCGVSYQIAAKTPCRNMPRERRTPLDAIEHNDQTTRLVSASEWAEAFGPLSSTFRVPEAPPEDTYAGAGGTFGGAGASAAWDTAPESAPSSPSTPASDSPSSGLSCGGGDSAPSSPSCGCGSESGSGKSGDE